METKKILIAEDERALSGALSEKFKSENFEVSSVTNGVDCIKQLTQEKPDMIILDLLMPDLGGIEVLDEIAKDKDLKQIPVLVLTNLDDMEKISEVMDKGFYDYLIKSDNTLEQIVERVKNKLDS